MIIKSPGARAVSCGFGFLSFGSEALKLDSTAVANLIGTLEFLKQIGLANHLQTLASRGPFAGRKALIKPAEVGNVPPRIIVNA